MKIKTAMALAEFLLVLAGFICVAVNYNGILNAVGVFLMIYGNNFNGRNK